MPKQTIELLSSHLDNKTPCQSYKLKLLLFKYEIKKKQCEICKLKTWNNLDIPLELHHCDGNNKNNKIWNLQVICPNCHSQTHNLEGKIKRKGRKFVTDEQMIDAIKSSYSKRDALIKCNLTPYGGSYERITRIIEQNNLTFLTKPKKESKKKQLHEKNPYVRPKKIDWPNIEELKSMIMSQSVRSIGKQLGVSDHSIRNHIKRSGIDVTTISLWSQKHGSCSSDWRKKTPPIV